MVYEFKEHEKFIVGQALAEYNGSNLEEILSKVGGTAVGIDVKAMELFVSLLKSKTEKLLKKKWVEPKHPIREYMCVS